jgi:hypothetical protein
MIKSADDYLVYNRQGTFLTEKGYLVALKMKLWQFSDVKEIDFPEGYKMSRIVLKWKSLVETENMFGKWFIKNLAILTMNNYEAKNIYL